MNIEMIRVGELKTNCYIVSDKDEAIVIDPGMDTGIIIENITGLKLKAIVLTHGHYDHVTEAFLLKEKTKAPIMIHEEDEPMMVFTTNLRATKLLHEDNLINVGNQEFTVIHTPGHSRGSICLYNKKEGILFSGDTLFYGTYGRVDLPGGSKDDMEISLKKLQKLPPETVVYPGHGIKTTIGDEKELI